MHHNRLISLLTDLSNAFEPFQLIKQQDRATCSSWSHRRRRAMVRCCSLCTLLWLGIIALALMMALVPNQPTYKDNDTGVASNATSKGDGLEQARADKTRRMLKLMTEINDVLEAKLDHLFRGEERDDEALDAQLAAKLDTNLALNAEPPKEREGRRIKNLKSKEEILEDIEAAADARVDAYEAKWAEFDAYWGDALAGRVPMDLIEPFMKKHHSALERRASLRKQRRELRRDTSKLEAERRAEVAKISAELDALWAEIEVIPAQFHAAKMKHEAEQARANTEQKTEETEGESMESEL